MQSVELNPRKTDQNSVIDARGAHVRRRARLLLAVFDSEFGYFGYISQEGHLVCPSMTRHIFPQCHIPDKDIIFRREIWADCGVEFFWNANR
jgi:hypothetical protein